MLVFRSAGETRKKAQLEELGIRVEKIPDVEPDGRPDLPAVLRRLANWRSHSVMIEGGATVNWTALAANRRRQGFLYYAPKILAGYGLDSVRGRSGFPAHEPGGAGKNIATASLRRRFRGGRIFAGSVRGVKTLTAEAQRHGSKS